MSFARYNRVVQYTSGNAVSGAHIEVRHELPGQPLASLFSDRAGTVSIGNPFDANSDGSFGFHVVGGSYQVRAYTGPSGSPTFEHILRYEGIGLNSESDSITTRTQRAVTAAGGVTVDADDADIIFINKTVGAATAVTLPLSASRTKPVMDRRWQRRRKYKQHHDLPTDRREHLFRYERDRDHRWQWWVSYFDAENRWNRMGSKLLKTG